jgi:hypothetical protein
MKAAQKKKLTKATKMAAIAQLFAVGAYVEVAWLVSQWDTANHFVSSILRSAGALIGM